MEQMTAPAQAPRAVHNAANQTPKHRFILKRKTIFQAWETLRIVTIAPTGCEAIILKALETPNFPDDAMDALALLEDYISGRIRER